MDLYQYPEKKENREYVTWAANEGRLPQFPVYVINQFHTAWGHQIIYDYQTLAELLESCGFTEVCRCEMSKSKHTELCDLESHFHVIPYDYCCIETMILEASKIQV